MLELNKIYNADCLELMKEIDDNSIDLICCDLPYNLNDRRTTWNEWDFEIDITKLFEEYKRIRKDNCPILLFATDLFSAKLIMANYQEYKYKWIWQKESGTGFLNAKRMPLRNFEEILVFYKEQPTYNPQMRVGKAYTCTKGSLSNNYANTDKIVTTKNDGDRYPLTIIDFNRDSDGIHPTQKPLALLDYLIRTYTNKGDIVLDNCSGSGSTAMACIYSDRKFIGIEKNEEYYKASLERIKQAKMKRKLF